MSLQEEEETDFDSEGEESNNERDLLANAFRESMRENHREARCRKIGLSSGCILLQRPAANILWCCEHKTWPGLGTFLWLVWGSLTALLQWSDSCSAMQYCEFEDGDAVMHATRGRVRFTDPKYFPPGFFETCRVLRPKDRASKVAAVIHKACVDLERVRVQRCAPIRLEWARLTQKPLSMTQFIVHELSVSGSAFMIACAWIRASAELRSTSILQDAVEMVDIPKELSIYPSALKPKDLAGAAMQKWFSIIEPSSSSS